MKKLTDPNEERHISRLYMVALLFMAIGAALFAYLYVAADAFNRTLTDSETIATYWPILIPTGVAMLVLHYANERSKYGQE